jgi:hypothetical protein
LSVSSGSFIHLDRGVGTHESAGLAAGALVLPLLGELRGKVADLVVLVRDDNQLLGTELDAEITSLAAVRVYFNIRHGGYGYPV